MTALEISQSVIVMTDLFLDLNKLDLRRTISQRENRVGLVKDVENIMEAGHGCQVNSIRHQVLA